MSAFLEQSYNLYDGVIIPVVTYHCQCRLILCTNVNLLCPQWLMVIHGIAGIPCPLDFVVTLRILESQMLKFFCGVDICRVDFCGD